MDGMDPRHFDVDLQDKLAKLKFHSTESIDALLWPKQGLDCPARPITGHKRNPKILPDLLDGQYSLVCARLKHPDYLRFHLLSKAGLRDLIKLNSTAMRAVMLQVVR